MLHDRWLMLSALTLALCLVAGGPTAAEVSPPDGADAGPAAPQQDPQSEEEPSKEEEQKGGESEKKAEPIPDDKKPVTSPGKRPMPQMPITEKVTVTVQRVETDLMQTPAAVTVFDQETLERQGVQNVRDLTTLVPNLDIATKNDQSAPIISMRGIRSTNTTELGDPSVGVHLDGIYSPRMQGILGLMFDNERVEVLRGPQGTLFGRNSTVGTINIITNKPDFSGFYSKINAQYANYNAPELQAIVNKPISDTFAIRFAGRYFERDSYIDGYWDPNQFDQRFLGPAAQNSPIIGPAGLETVGGIQTCDSPLCFAQTQNSNWWADNLDVPIRELIPADSDNFYLNSEEWAYRISGRWEPKYEDMSLNLSFQHFRSDGAGGVDLVNCDKLRGRPTYAVDDGGEIVLDAEGQPVITGVDDCSSRFPEDDTYQAVVNVPGRFMLDIMYGRALFNWDIKDNLRFVVNTGVEYQDRESVQDFDQSLNPWDQSFSFLPGTGSNSAMAELQFQSYGNRKFNWIAGTNYFYEKTSTSACSTTRSTRSRSSCSRTAPRRPTRSSRRARTRSRRSGR